MSETKIINIDSITVNNRIRKTFDGIEDLAESIRKEGLLAPLVVTPSNDEYDKYILLAGERRLRALKFLEETNIPVVIVENNSEKQNLLIEIKENCERNGFLCEELVTAGKRLEAIFKLEALERKKAGIKIDDNSKKGRTSDLIAKELNLGCGKQYEKYKFIVDNRNYLDDETYQKWNHGEIAADSVYRVIKHMQNIEQSENTNRNDTEHNFNQRKKEFTKVQEQSTHIIDFFNNIDYIEDSNGLDIKNTILDTVEVLKNTVNTLAEIIDNMKYDKDENVFILPNK